MLHSASASSEGTFSVKLEIRKKNGHTFRLVEDDGAQHGLAFECADPPGSQNDGVEVDLLRLNGRLNIEIMACDGCSHPMFPDMWAVAHAFCEEDDEIEILEYTPVEYPEGAVF